MEQVVPEQALGHGMMPKLEKEPCPSPLSLCGQPGLQPWACPEDEEVLHLDFLRCSSMPYKKDGGRAGSSHSDQLYPRSTV